MQVNNLDPLRGIFTNEDTPLVALRETWPHFEVEANGLLQANNFDNNEAIIWYEGHLQELCKVHGFSNAAIPVLAGGIATLYDIKAGLEKDWRFYDKAIEFLKFSNACREETFGRLDALKMPAQQAANDRIAYLNRKKTRRMAKDEAAGQTKEEPPVPQVDKKGPPASHPAMWDVTRASLMNMMEQMKHWPVHVTEVQVTQSGWQDFIEFTLSDERAALFWRQRTGEEDRVPRPREEGECEYRPPVLCWDPFVLRPFEYLVGMVTNERPEGTLGACAFHTSAGRRSQWYTFDAREPHGIERFYYVQEGNQLVGMSCSDEGGINLPIVLIEEPIMAGG